METKVITEEQFNLAVDAIKSGETIAFKTDTIYGLSCLATDSFACEKLAQIKGREGKPLILLVGENMDIKKYVKHIPDKLKRVIDKFWPGPLTIIFESSYPFCDTITCGKPTIAIRMPNDRLTQKLILGACEPIVSTSANLSGQTPLNTPNAIFDAFNGKISYIIDSKVPDSTLSSTIIAIDNEDIMVLREGAITKADIESVIN